jgi:ABC-type phosphate transport system substrate-binding protein
MMHSWMTAIALALTLAAAIAGELAVIVPKSATTEKLSQEEVVKYFLKKVKKWPDGKKIKSVDSQGPVRTAFLKSVLKMSPADLDRHWIELQYQTGASPADKEDGDAGAVAAVAKTEGSLAVVDAAAAGANADVKVVFTLKY